MKNIKILTVVLIAILLGLFIKNYFNSNLVSTTKYNSGGSVDVGITFLNPDKDDDDYWVFKMFVDTHTVNLDGYNYQDIISVSVDSTTIPKDFIEVESHGSGHHLTHYIKMPKIINNELSISNENQILKIDMRNLSGVESRLFVYNLKDYNLNYGEIDE